MKNVSNLFKEELNNGNRNFVKSCTITLKDGTVLPITQADTWQNGFSIDEAVSNDNTFDIGSAMMDEFTLHINNIYENFSAYDFEQAVISNVRIGLNLSNGTTEYVKRGVYTVDEANYNGSIITLNCFDNMSKFDKDYSISNLSYPTILLNIVKDACTCCNVSMASDIASFPNSSFTVNTRPISDGLTFRKVLTWIAQISGIWFKCNENGQLSSKSLDMALVDSLSGNIDGGTFSPWTTGDVLDGGTFNPWNTGSIVDGGSFSDMSKYHHIFSIINPDIATDDVVVTGVQVKEQVDDEVKTYLNGTTGYVLSIEENGLIQDGKGSTVASYLGNKFIGLRFRPLTVSCLTDLSIEAGDLAYVTDRHNRSYFTIITRQTLTPGKFQEIACNAETPKKNSSSRYSQSTQIYQEFRKNLEKQKTEFDKAIEDLSTKLSQTEGAYTTIETLSSGGKIFYLHNKPTVAESQMIWKMTAEAWGVSTDGGETWNAGMTVDGVVIARILNTIGINADWINTGALTVKDSNGNLIFEVNKDTKSVFINAQYVTIGSKNVSQAISDVDTKAGNAQTTADSASTAASNAQSTANTANTNAQNAQSTADKAQTSANNAQSTANTASTKADNAQSTADTAKDIADVALDTANNNSIDLDNLKTQEAIFNLLTQNGVLQGIYMENGQLYINASYLKSGTVSADLIKGGIIKLGGNVLSGYGSLQLYNAGNSLVGTLSTTGGLMFYDTNSATEKYYVSIDMSGVKCYQAYNDATYGQTVLQLGLFADYDDHTLDANLSGVTCDSVYVRSPETVTTGNTAVFNSNYIRKLSSSSERYKDIDRVLTDEDISNAYNIDVYLAKYKDDYLSKNDERYQKYMPMFSVENMEKYLPISVDHNPDGSPEMWNSQILMAVLFQMTKSQKNKIDSLQNEITELKNLLSTKGVI